MMLALVLLSCLLATALASQVNITDVDADMPMNPWNISVRQKIDFPEILECAKQNQKEQEKQFPDWDYRFGSPKAEKEPIAYNWEPILESVPGCNGLSEGSLKEFSLLVILDASWVVNFNRLQKHFSEHGYPTLESSPNLMLDRVSYLMERQFGVRVKASRVFVFENLYENCARNESKHFPEDGTFNTTTKLQMKSRGISRKENEAAILRLGIQNPLDRPDYVYCHSYSSGPGMCNGDHMLVNIRKMMTTRSWKAGKVIYEGNNVLAHEIAHAFGICHNRHKHCSRNHVTPEANDLMYDYHEVTKERPRSQRRGFFYKFLTACTPIYKDLLCKNVAKANPKCGVAVAPCKDSGDWCSGYTTRCDVDIIRRSCPAMCNACNDPSPTPKPCVDGQKSCPRYHGHCHRSMVQRVCRKTCGTC